MYFKVLLTVAVVLSAHCDASSLPDTTETSSKPQDPTPSPEPLPTVPQLPEPLPTVPQLPEPLPIPQCSETTNQGFGDASRVTCDLFQSEPLCAAHCLLLGHSGGYCNSQKVCVCRSRAQSDAAVVDKLDEKAPCGGGCAFSDQCYAYSGQQGCRCTWFECILHTAEADLTDVEQFELFIQQYSGNTAMLTSVEKAIRSKH